MKILFCISLILSMGCARAGYNKKSGEMWFNGYGRAKFSETKEIESKPVIQFPPMKFEN